MNRHEQRLVAMQSVYQHLLLGKDIRKCVFDVMKGSNDIDGYLYSLTIGTVENKEAFEQKINELLRDDWDFDRLSMLEQAILLISFQEILANDTPKAVVINEAITLAKKYCDDNGIELICVTSPITPGVMKTLGMEKVDGLFTSFFEEQNVTYYNFNKARLDILARKDTDYGDKEGHMGGELAERYSEVLAEVLKGHFNNTLDKSKYFYDTFEQMYEEMEEQ